MQAARTGRACRLRYRFGIYHSHAPSDVAACCPAACAVLCCAGVAVLQAYTQQYLEQQRRDKVLAAHRRTKQQAFWLSLGLALGSSAYRCVQVCGCWVGQVQV